MYLMISQPPWTYRNLLPNKLELGDIFILGQVTILSNNSQMWSNSSFRAQIKFNILPMFSCRVSLQGNLNVQKMPLCAHKHIDDFCKSAL